MPGDGGRCIGAPGGGIAGGICPMAEGGIAGGGCRAWAISMPGGMPCGGGRRGLTRMPGGALLPCGGIGGGTGGGPGRCCGPGGAWGGIPGRCCIPGGIAGGGGGIPGCWVPCGGIPGSCAPAGSGPPRAPPCCWRRAMACRTCGGTWPGWAIAPGGWPIGAGPAAASCARPGGRFGRGGASGDRTPPRESGTRRWAARSCCKSAGGSG